MVTEAEEARLLIEVRPGLGNISSRAFNNARAAPLQPLDAPESRSMGG
jgi:hypothetical protein